MCLNRGLHLIDHQPKDHYDDDDDKKNKKKKKTNII